MRPQQPEVRACSQCTRRFMHDLFMRDIAVRKDHLINRLVCNEGVQRFLRHNLDAVRIQRSCQSGRIRPPRDVGNLGGSESHNPVIGVGSKHYIEVVEVSAGRTHNDDLDDPTDAICHWTSPALVIFATNSHHL